MVYLELIAGFALLAAGGDFLVRGAVAVARRIGVSELMIGLTPVGFGTSTPELVASIEAALVNRRHCARQCGRQHRRQQLADPRGRRPDRSHSHGARSIRA